MKPVKLPNNPDVVMIYHDRDSVEPAIQQIMELELDFKAYKLDPNKLHSLAAMKPKVLLLSSNNVKSTIQFYIDYLEEYQQNIAPHSAILLINNRETFRAYLACENGLFDSYVIINPLNEPYRLKLVLLQELQLIKNRNSSSLEQLASEGEDELASCIEHGLALKKSFLNQVSKAEEGLISATNTTFDNPSSNGDAKSVLQNLIGVTLDEMNENVSADIDEILSQLLALKKSNEALKQDIEKFHTQKEKTVVGVNTDLLTSDESTDEDSATSCYKVLIAEPSDIFNRVVEDIFAGTVYKYLLVNDGQEALKQIEQFKPDVILLAYDLPTFNGIQITKIIRDQANEVPIVAYTHHKDRAIIKSWIPLGLSGYLIKPSRKSAILSVITKAIENPIEIIHNHKSADKGGIQWIDEYSVGNREIDEQHKTLFSMINDFFQEEDKDKAVLIFQNLTSYIDLQFDAEENLLRQINYPGTEEHILKHQELRDKFHVLNGKVENYNIETLHKVAMFLYNWLAKHILKSDMEYKSYALSIEEESFME